MSVGQRRKLLLRSLVRIMVYGLLMVVLNQLMFWDAEQQGQEMKFMEETFTEWTQQLMLLIMTVIFLYCVYRYQQFRCLGILLAGISAAGLVREYNNFFNTQVFDGAWQLLALMVIAVTMVFVWKNRTKFWEDLARYSNSLSFGFLLAGFLTTFVFSRLFGRTVFWETLMEEQYFRSVKNAAEESVELLGYGLLLIAAIEFFILTRSVFNKADVEPKFL